MKAHYGNYIRAYIPEKCLIEEIIDLRGAKVFKEATNDPIILILRRNGKIRNHQINIVIVKKEVSSDEDELILKNTLESISKNIGKFYQDEYLISYAIAQKRLNSEIRTEKDTGRKYLSDWDLTPANIAEVRRKIISASKGLTLKDVCDVYRGIRTGANEIFTVNREKEIEYSFDKEVSKKLIEGKDVRKYLINYRNLKLLYLTHETDIEKYPTVKKYLLKFKDTLEQRAQYRQRKERGEDIEWFEIEQPLSPSIFEVPKIVTQRVSNDYGFAFDDGEFYTLETCSTIVPKLQYRRKVIFLLGLLNSKPMEFFAKTDGKALGKKGYEFEKQFLDRLPIYLPQTKPEQALADEITNKVKQILDKVKLEQKTENFPDEYIKEYRSKGEEFYSIKISFNSNHKAVEPVVEKDIDGRGYNIVIGKKPVFVESKVKANYVSAALKGERAKKDEKRQILIPKSDAIVEEILKKLEEDKARIKSPSVAELEGEINELVYKLYGLNEEDVKVIEDFLRWF